MATKKMIVRISRLWLAGVLELMEKEGLFSLDAAIIPARHGLVLSTEFINKKMRPDFKGTKQDGEIDEQAGPETESDSGDNTDGGQGESGIVPDDNVDPETAEEQPESTDSEIPIASNEKIGEVTNPSTEAPIIEKKRGRPPKDKQ